MGSSVKTARSISHERVLAFQRAKDEKRYVGRLVRDALTVGRGDVTSEIYLVSMRPPFSVCGENIARAFHLWCIFLHKHKTK